MVDNNNAGNDSNGDFWNMDANNESDPSKNAMDAHKIGFCGFIIDLSFRLPEDHE